MRGTRVQEPKKCVQPVLHPTRGTGRATVQSEVQQRTQGIQ